MCIINRWHTWLNMPKNDRAWHEKDVADEIEELKEANAWLARWSEYSDVVYTITRAHWSGHQIAWPISMLERGWGLMYMYPKYTLRWMFFRQLGKKFKKKFTMVRNPAKTEKLRKLAEMENIDPDAFVAEAKKMLRFWPLLP